LNLDSIDELRLYCELHPGGGIGLRINPRVAAGFHPHVIAGAPGGKLGIDLDDLPGGARHRPSRRCRSAHAACPSRLVDQRAGPYVAACDVPAGLAADLPSVTTLNLGGGFGIPYDAETPTFPIERLERQLRAAVDRFEAAHRARPESWRWSRATIWSGRPAISPRRCG
jgi:diaminopimelate decarboxylase